ncbi:MAG TPA: S-layer homology domain-containing protein [Coleofasciculaceae cyanobacterium]
MSQLPDERSRSPRESNDEWIAVLVALLMFGSLFVWFLGKGQGRSAWTWWGRAGASTSLSGQGDRADKPSEPPTPSIESVKPSVKPATPVISPTPAPTAANPATADSARSQTQLPVQPVPVPIVPGNPPVPEVAAPPFKDVSTQHWAYPFLERLRQETVIAGFADGSFQPDQPVTRAQLAAILRDAWQGSAVRSPLPFKDLTAKHWAKGAVDQSVAQGLMRGYPNGTFAPDRPVSRLELYITLTSGLNLAVKDAATMQTELQRYADGPSLVAWAKPKIAAASQSTLVTYYPARDRLDAQRPATRADVAVALYQTLVFQKRQPPIASPYLTPQP